MIKRKDGKIKNYFVLASTKPQNDSGYTKHAHTFGVFPPQKSVRLTINPSILRRTKRLKFTR